VAGSKIQLKGDNIHGILLGTVWVSTYGWMQVGFFSKISKKILFLNFYIKY